MFYLKSISSNDNISAQCIEGEVTGFNLAMFNSHFEINWKNEDLNHYIMWTKYYVTMDNKERFYSEGEINYLILQIKNP